MGPNDKKESISATHLALSESPDDTDNRALSILEIKKPECAITYWANPMGT